MYIYRPNIVWSRGIVSHLKIEDHEFHLQKTRCSMYIEASIHVTSFNSMGKELGLGNERMR